jgi:YHS domain-containing protein
MATERVLDPVCGMRIDPGRAAATVRHGGQAYHFCSEGCARRFQASPSRFVGAGGRPEGMQPMAADAGASSNVAFLSAKPLPPRFPAASAVSGTVADGKATSWRDYRPLMTILGLLLLVVVAMAISDPSGGRFALREAIARFMAGFFLVFAGFKLLDLRGFAEGYATYDLLAQKVPAYGYVYPFIELLFGLLMVAGYDGWPLLVAEIAVMGFSGVGVALKLAKREPFTCACLGTFLKVPLTKVTLVEDFGMVALAVALLLL